MTYSFNGFGNNLPVVELKTGQPFNLGKDLSITQFRKRAYIELTSISKLVEKDISHVLNWAKNNSISIHEFQLKNGKRIQTLSQTSFLELLENEVSIDNPMAQKFMKTSGQIGIKVACQEAEQQGKDYIEIEGIRAKFTKVGDEYGFSPEEIAKLCGTSSEELEQTLQSEKFLSWWKHNREL